MVQLKDFFLKLWFRSLEVVSLSGICGLAFFPSSWPLHPFAYQDYEYIKFYKCALAGRCQCWRGEINYKQRRLPFEKLVAWGMRHVGSLPSWGSHILCKEATFWPLKNFSQWNLIAPSTSHIRTLLKVQTAHHLWRWSDYCAINICEIIHISRSVFFSISVFLNLCNSQLVFFSICAFLN